MTTVVYVRDADSKVHKAVLDGEATLTDERCNLDALRDREVLTELPQDVAYEALCQRCFPRMLDPEDPT